VDEYQETSVPDVFAIGDCAISYNNAFQGKMYMPIGSATARGASIVASTIANRANQATDASNRCVELKSYGTQGSNALQVFGLNLSSTGLTYEFASTVTDATTGQPKFKVSCANYTGSQLAPYMQPRIVTKISTNNCSEESTQPALDGLNSGDVKIQIVYETDSRRIIGAQVASFSDVVVANHLFSLAISQNMTIEQLYNLDMFFLPQLNQLYNAVRRCLQRVL
jgi:NADPH-dependent 2,4-dienoyl-CoA reductase/sulfur reductase-like enzyme